MDRSYNKEGKKGIRRYYVFLFVLFCVYNKGKTRSETHPYINEYTSSKRALPFQSLKVR